MIAKIRQRLPTASPLRGRLLDRVILWSGILLAVSVVAFGAYYYVDQESKNSPPSNDEVMQRQLTLFEQAVIEDPNNITNRLALADTYLSLERFADAVAQYEAALVINDQSTLGHVGLGRAQLGTGDLAGATENFQKIIDKSKEADISGELVESAHYYLGSIALQQGNPDEAIKQLTEATKLERSDSDAWYLMGKAYMQAGKPEEAVDALMQAVLFVPDFTEAYEALAEVFDEKGATAGALYARGMAAYSKGELEDAARLLEDAVTASPTLAEAYSGLGLVRETMGQRDAAVLAYQQALHLKPDDFNAGTGLARLTQAESGTSTEEELPANHPGAEAGDGSEQGVTP